MPTHPLWRPFAPVNADRARHRVASRQTPPGPLGTDHLGWAADYEHIERLIRAAIREQILDLAHVGSTAVPHLLAKPVIDVDLIVPDVADENAYLPALADAGFRLIFGDDIAGDAHRQLTLAHPNANLHVWGPGAVEPRRHVLFAAWLRGHPDDLELYAEAKREALEPGVASYNDAKAAVVYDIYERAFEADPAHPHDPRPRVGRRN